MSPKTEDKTIAIGRSNFGKDPERRPEISACGMIQTKPQRRRLGGEGTMAKARMRRMAVERARPKEGRMTCTTEAGPEGLVENVKQQRSQSYGEVHLLVQL